MNGDSGVGDIIVDNEINGVDSSSPYEIYNLNGVRLATSLNNLSTGIYIVRQGNLVKKIAVR